MNSFTLAKTHLWRKKLSTLIALIGIAMSVATSGILLRLFLLSNARFATLAQTGDAIVAAKGNDIGILLTALNLEGPYPDFLPAVLYQSLAANQTVHFEDGASTGVSPVETAIPFVIFAQVQGSHQTHRVIATNELFTQTTYPTLPKFSEGQWPTAAREVVLGSQAAESLKAHLGDDIPGRLWIDKNSNVHDEIHFKVAGILKPTGKAWDRGIYSNLETSREVFEAHQADLKSIWKEKLLQYFLIYLRPPHGLDSDGMNWLKNLINRRTVAQTVAVAEEIQSLQDLTGTQRELGIFVSLIIIFLGALSTATMMITRFESMTQQLAILRAVGYAKKELYLVLFWEAALIGSIACLAGGLLDASLFPWVRELLGTSVPSNEIVSMGIFNSWPIWATAFVGSLLSILIPLGRLQRQNIHSSLRNIS